MPRTILILSSTPRDMTPLRVHKEAREIEDAIRRARDRDGYRVVVSLGTRARDVHGLLLRHRPALVHFSGHGRGEQGVVLEDDDGDSLPVSSVDLARMLGHFRDGIECVLINSCWSEAQIDEIAEHIPFVIGMNQALNDRAAISFATAFYEALANGESIPFSYDMACSAVSLDGLAIDRVAVLAGQGLEVPRQPRRVMRWRGRVVATALMVATVVAAGLLMQWQQQPSPELPLSGRVMVAGGQLDSGGRHAWQHLCTALREHGEQAVRCVVLPPASSDEALIDAARAAGASLVVTVEAGPVARVLPVPGRDGELLLQGLPAVSIARPETRTALAQIVYVLAQGPRDAPLDVAARLPIEPDRVMPWRVTALAALARVWTQAPWNSQDRAVLSEIARRCRGEPTSLADAHCALIHYVLYAEVAPEDPDAGARLDEVVAQGPRGIADAAALFLLRRRCIEDPAWARRELLEVAARTQGCQRWYLMTPATCVLVASGGDGADDAAIRALAEPGEHESNTCPDDVRAGAYYDRALWLAETWNASTRAEWEQAVESYEQAFRLDPRADHAQGLAEARLFLRRLVPDRADELARGAVDVLKQARTAVDEPTAVFLAWLADDASDAHRVIVRAPAALAVPDHDHGVRIVGDQVDQRLIGPDGLAGDASDKAALARLCAIYRELPPGEVAVPYVSRRLACPGGNGDDSPRCRAYRLLSAPRPVAGGGDLEESVCGAAGGGVSHKSERKDKI